MNVLNGELVAAPQEVLLHISMWLLTFSLINRPRKSSLLSTEEIQHKLYFNPHLQGPHLVMAIHTLTSLLIVHVKICCASHSWVLLYTPNMVINKLPLINLLTTMPRTIYYMEQIYRRQLFFWKLPRPIMPTAFMRYVGREGAIVSNLRLWIHCNERYNSRSIGTVIWIRMNKKCFISGIWIRISNSFGELMQCLLSHSRSLCFPSQTFAF